MGTTADRKRILLLAAARIASVGLPAGRPVYFFERDAQGKVNPQGGAVVESSHGSFVVCQLKTGTVDASTIVSLSPRLTPAMARPQALDTADARLVFGLVQGAASEEGMLTVKPDISFSAPAQGYLYQATGVITHPHTRELLSAGLGAGVKVSCRQAEKGGILVKPVGEFKLAEEGKGVVLSSVSLGGHSRVDLAGPASAFDGGSSSAFWETLPNSSWKQRGERFVSRRLVGNEPGYPYAVAASPLSPHGQLDMVIAVDRMGNAEPEDWVRDLMIELFAEPLTSGITFSLGAGEGGGFSVIGASRDLLVSKARRPSAIELPKDSGVRTAAVWEAGQPALKLAKHYAVRIRRVGPDMAFYVNGKRLAVVTWPGSAGKSLRMSVMAPESALRVVSASIRKHSKSAVMPVSEPTLGEFGYVAAVQGQMLVLDRDIRDLEVNGKVSIVEVGSVVKGEKSTTVVVNKIGHAVVTRMDALTATARIVSATKPIERGMKALVGDIPATMHLTGARLLDIDQGL